MLEARKNRLFEALFSVYNRNLLRRRFDSFNVSGLRSLTDFPVIFYANHSSWWDGLAAFHLSRCLKLNSFVMMEEKQLKRFFLFRRLGAFSINREKPRDTLLSLSYAARLLRSSSDPVLWIFPQGEILPNDLRPLVFYNGLSRIVKELGRCTLSSISIRYEFLGDFKPSVFVKIDQPRIIDFTDFKEKTSLTRFITGIAEKNLDELKGSVVSRSFDDFRNII
ncbi:MAG: lysophospholipid acyltransferase family protein [Acidobacteria bacterium]|nr:lysophospholipid acyltransferase family protein [Acidobacteriota bacterium]